jgi:hypothetical protein
MNLCVHRIAEDGYVFVKVFNDEYLDWQRIKDRDLKGQEVIKCSYCNTAAYILDHLYPYHSEMNMCREHYADFKAGKFKPL